MLPRHGRFQAQRPGNEGNLLVTKSSQVLNRLTNPVLIIDSDIADPRARWAYVYIYNWHLADAQVLDEMLLHSERQDSDAFNAAFQHASNGNLHSLGIVIRGTEKDFVVMLDGNPFEHLHDFREERISDVGDDKPEDAAAPGHERSGLGVRVISKLINNVPDPLRHLWIDGGYLVHHTGHGGCRNSCSLGDFPDVLPNPLKVCPILAWKPLPADSRKGVLMHPAPGRQY